MKIVMRNRFFDQLGRKNENYARINTHEHNFSRSRSRNRIRREKRAKSNRKEEKRGGIMAYFMTHSEKMCG